jgi:hypothetical protein
MRTPALKHLYLDHAEHFPVRYQAYRTSVIVSLYAVFETLTLSFYYPVHAITDIIKVDICYQKFSLPPYVYDFQ